MTSIPVDFIWARRPVGAADYRPWLTDRGSLTQRIADRADRFRVEVMFQGPRRPTRDEAALFTAGGGARVIVREVYLLADDRPVVFAHSVAHPADIRGAWRSLTGLGNRSLGSRLFSDPCVLRRPLRFRKITPAHELYRRAIDRVPDVRAGLWARRSLFILHNAPILVTEVFLPGILEL